MLHCLTKQLRTTRISVWRHEKGIVFNLCCHFLSISKCPEFLENRRLRELQPVAGWLHE